MPQNGSKVSLMARSYCSVRCGGAVQAAGAGSAVREGVPRVEGWDPNITSLVPVMGGASDSL